MEQYQWFALHYTLPREPSRVRVSVWRKLKKMGAVSLQPSMWVMPLRDGKQDVFKKAKEEILRNGGEAFTITFTADEDGERRIFEKFQAARDEEYRGFLEQCEDFRKELDKETVRKNFTVAEMEENEEDLSKLRQWLGKIRARDVFGSPLGEKAEGMLADCGKLLAGFCEKVCCPGGQFQRGTG